MKQFYLFFLLFPITILAQPGSESSITPINATIPFQGTGETVAHIGTGEYKIYYDNLDGVLDKPIFFVDGFDPSDSRTIALMYDLLNYGDPVENLADAVRDEGYDIVVLNFPTYTSSTDGTTVINGGADFIQRNAFILVELINTINNLKVGTEEDVVIGPSMGGLISRYALRYMEQNTMNHETRLFLSFDSPHQGANVPIGIQYLFNYMVNGDPAITEAEPLVNGLLNSAAAKQMLVDHYLGHVDGGGILQTAGSHTPVGAPNFRNAFQAEIDLMGFPQNTRNAAISNGSGLSEMTGTPGMELLNHTFDTGQVAGFDTRAIIAVHFTPLADSSIEVTDFVGQVNLFGWNDVYTYAANAESFMTSDGIDSAPGGQFDLFSFDDGTNALITEFVANLNSQYFNFIPTLSSLAISNQPNWYAAPNVNDSPFTSTYIPNSNEPHVTLTAGNVAFALNEILNPPLSVSEVISQNPIKIGKNPITNELAILTNEAFENASVHIIDLTGKLVYNQKMYLSERTTIPLDLESGLYLLNIETNTNTSLKTKIVVK